MKSRKSPANKPAAAQLPAEPQRTADRQWSVLLAGGALIGLVLLAYAPIVRDKFIWDDDFYVTHNPTLRSLSGLWAMWFIPKSLPQYYPLVHSTFWVEYHLWGLNPLGYHVVNVLLHAASTILFWRLLVQLRVPGAWLAAALLAVHPVDVESVAWITERKNVFSLVLALSSMLCYLRYSPPAPAADGEQVVSGGWRWYAFAMLLFVGALLSKTVVASLPAVLLVIYWWQRGRITLRDVLPLLPFFVVGAALGIMTALLERFHVGAEGAEWDFTIFDRILIAGRAVWFYAAKLAWPQPLIFFYQRWKIDPGAPWQYLFPLAALGLVAALWLARRRIGRGPLAAALIFGGVLFPALGFLNVYPFRYAFVADHFQYHASLSLFALVGAGGALFANRLPSAQRQAARYASAAVLALLTIVCWQQIGVYYDLETLYRDTIAKNPTSVFAYSNLALVLSGWNRQDEAVDMGRQAVEVAPWEPGVHSNLGAILLNIYKNDLAKTELLDEAIKELNEAIRLNPDYAQAHSNLALAMIVTNQTDAAMQHLSRALEINPLDPKSMYGMGTLYALLGETDQAQEYYRRALQRDPDYVDAHYGLGLELRGHGKIDEAIEQWEAGARVNPAHADTQYALGDALSARGDLRSAAPHFAAALQARPTYYEALVQLAVTLLNMGEANAAIPYFEQAVRKSPDNADAHFGLAIALIRQRRTSEASAHLQEVIRLDPLRPEPHFELANLLAADKKFPAAIAEYSAAVQLRPDYFDALENLGAALLSINEVNRALPYLEQALQLQPQNPQAQSNLAHARSLLQRESNK